MLPEKISAQSEHLNLEKKEIQEFSSGLNLQLNKEMSPACSDEKHFQPKSSALLPDQTEAVTKRKLSLLKFLFDWFATETAKQTFEKQRFEKHLSSLSDCQTRTLNRSREAL